MIFASQKSNLNNISNKDLLQKKIYSQPIFNNFNIVFALFVVIFYFQLLEVFFSSFRQFNNQK